MDADRMARPFKVLRVLAGSREGMRLTEISETLDVPLSSTHNLLQAMEAAGLLSARGRAYVLGPLAVSLGLLIADSLEVRTVARGPLERLAATLGDDIYLAMKLEDRVVYVDRFQGTRPVKVDIPLGRSLYLHATAVGKLFSALDQDLRRVCMERPLDHLTDATIVDPDEFELELARIVESEVSVSRGEAVEGTEGLAVPIRDNGGGVVGAIHVSAFSGRITNNLQQVAEAAREAATTVEQHLGRSAQATQSRRAPLEHTVGEGRSTAKRPG